MTGRLYTNYLVYEDSEYEVVGCEVRLAYWQRTQGKTERVTDPETIKDIERRMLGSCPACFESWDSHPINFSEIHSDQFGVERSVPFRFCRRTGGMYPDLRGETS